MFVYFLFTFSAVCLQFSNVNNSAVCLLFNFQAKNIDFCKVFCHEKLLILSILFTFVSCLFVYLSAVCLPFSAVCLLFRIFKQNVEKSWLFCQNGDFKFLFNLLFCLHVQLFVYNFQLFVYIFFTWQCKQKCKQTAENHEFKLHILAKKSWNFNVFASNSKSKQTADCLHF